nr:hypothetical protein CFP56_13545 [Quercus suber]
MKPSSSLKPSVPSKLLKSSTPSSRTHSSLQASSSSSVTPFHVLSEECFLDGKDLEFIRGRLQIPGEVVFRLPHTAVERPELEERFQGCVKVALEFALTLSSKDFKGLIGAHQLYECCLGPEPSELVVAALPSSVLALPITHSKGKDKAGKSVWEYPATTIGQAHNVITDKELKGLSTMPSHELVSHHIHKLVFGESLQLMTNYLSIEEKLVVAQSKAEFAETKSSHLRKDLVKAMDQAMKSKEKADELKKALNVEKKLVAQKDDELQATLIRTTEARNGVIAQFQESDHFSDLLFTQYFKGFELFCRWILKHQGEAIDLSALDFETVDVETIADKAQEKERRATEEVAFVLANIETEVGIETTVVGAEIATAKGVEFASLRGFKLTTEDLLFHSRVCSSKLFLAVEFVS